MELDIRKFICFFAKYFSIPCFIFLAFIFLFPQKIFAHFAGQAPYFKINGDYTILYNVPLNGNPAPGYILPEDNAPKNYLYNQPLSFELDKSFLPISQTDIEKAKFTWDFGDGAKGEGFIQTHTYSKIGSYVLVIQIKNVQSYISPFPNYPFESVLINILPQENYLLPKSVIMAGKKSVNDPLTEYVWLDFSKPIQFDGAKSKAGTVPIVSYFWDFGDQTSSKVASISHTYDKTIAQLYPMLRVIDSNGFISDTFIELDNSLYARPQYPFTQIQTTSGKNTGGQNKNQNFLVNFSIRLNDYIKRLMSDAFNSSGKVNYFLLLAILIFAFFAGSLHALTPGHGKTLMAAFLIGKGKGKIKDVLILAFSMTFTHTVVIYILGIAFLIINIHYPISSLIPYFDKIGALLVIFLALTLLRSGYKNFIHAQKHSQNIEHAHNHTNKIKSPDKVSYLSLFLAGASGGITPCIDALALLILAVTLNKILFGLIVIFVFSLGLAGSIVALGLFLVIGNKRIGFEKRIGKTAEIYAPIVAGIFILFIAFRLLFS